MILTNALKKTYSSLSTAKGRKETGLFMAQGTKCVLDTVDYFQVQTILCNDQWFQQHQSLQDLYDLTVCKNSDLEKATTLSTPPAVIGIYKIPAVAKPNIDGKLVLALDGIQDPGNLGTIMRLCDWMGVTDIIASDDTVDVWSPKVIQATMGAISRINVYYTDLPAFLSEHRHHAIYGTYLEGESIYNSPLSETGIIVMGNEGKGIRKATDHYINHSINIPPYPAGRTTSESLNVATATAITLAEFRRRMLK